MDNLGKDDILVILAGSNDVAKNEAVDFLRSLKKTLQELRTRMINTIVFSVPHRHDLPPWSVVNTEVNRTNEKIKTICKYLKNCTFVNISELGKRFHVPHGLHLNALGKMYVSHEISSCVNRYLLSKENLFESNSIVLKEVG